jgi:glycosyltransferase involved in cell wall biosynthesis
MNIAIASSGLGHVSRGIETWAADLAAALHAAGVSVTLFKAAGPAINGHDITLNCWKRSDPKTLRLLKFTRRGGWRIGLGSAYNVEQTTFALKLIPQLRRRNIDILHVQDPRIAALIQRAQKLGLVKTHVILAHGTEEDFSFLKKITYLQHLAPWHLEEAKAAGVHKPTWTAIPNFIDTDAFAPASGSGVADLRAELRIPGDATIILTVAAIKRQHKRIDHLLDEFGALRRSHPALDTYLVIAGGHEADTDELVRQGTQQLGDRVRFLVRFPRSRIANLYRAADVFTLASLKEMMPIALIEAAASGLPCVVHPHPVMQWMIGPGGMTVDMAAPGALAGALARLSMDAAERRLMGERARVHCVEHFSRDQVVGRILRYYQRVMERGKIGAGASQVVEGESE